MFKEFQQWWQQRDSREQLLLKGGFILSMVLIIYSWAWNPLSTAVEKQAQQAQQDQQNITWFRHTLPELQTYRSLGWDINKILNNNKKNQTNKNILNRAEQSIQQAGIIKFMTNIKQIQTNKTPDINSYNFKVKAQSYIAIQFEAVPFIKLMQWLRQLWNQQHIVLTEIKLNKNSTSGTVNVALKLGF